MFLGWSWFVVLRMIGSTFFGMFLFLLFAFELKAGSGLLEIALWPVEYVFLKKKAQPWLISFEHGCTLFLSNVKRALLVAGLATLLSWGLLILVVVFEPFIKANHLFGV